MEPTKRRIGFKVPTTKRVWNRGRIAKTDPRDTGLSQGDSLTVPLAWIAFIAAIALIAFLMFGGSNHGNNPLAPTGITANGVIKPPGTAGSDGSSQLPRNSRSSQEPRR